MTYETQSLEAFVTLQRGFDLPSSSRRKGRFPVVAASGIIGKHDEAKVSAPGVTLGRSGSIGSPQFIAQDFWPLNTTLWVRDFRGNDPKFAFYVLRTIDFTSFDAGAAVPTLNRNHLTEIRVPKVAPRQQIAIAALLSDIDQKIDLNNLISKRLEQIAQTIFKSWFVDFDPVHAKARGEQPEGMDAETAALFPNSFEDSEHGPIPSGWSIGEIRDLCSVVTNGSTPLRSNSDFWESGSVDWFKTGELADGYLLDSGERISMEAVKSTSVKTLPAGSVLMAIYAAPTLGRLGILTREATFNQACTGMVPKAEFSTAMVYLWLKTRRDWFNSLATGTGQQNISKAIVEECPITIPNADVVQKFKLLTSSIFEQMEVLAKQNKALAEIRDSLLPRLISGELEIPEELLGE